MSLPVARKMNIYYKWFCCLGTVTHICYPSTRKTEAEGLLLVYSQPGFIASALSQNSKENKAKERKRNIFYVWCSTWSCVA